MAEIKWIKLSTGMFDDEKIKIIEDMPEADTIIVIWLKLMTMTGRSNMGGYIMLTESIPYTEDMLISVIKRPLPVIKMALSIFERFGMLEISEQGAFFLPNWEKHQNTESLEKVREYERKRKAEQRSKRKKLQLGESSPGNVPDSPGDVTPLEVRSKTKEKEGSCCLTPEAEINSKDEGIPSSRQDTAPVTPETGTDSIQDKISSADMDYRNAVATKYLQRRGKGLMISMKDESVISKYIADNIPLQTALDGIDKAFDDFKPNPKNKYDGIKSLNYCTDIIYALHASRETVSESTKSIETEVQGQSDQTELVSEYTEVDIQSMLVKLRAKQGG